MHGRTASAWVAPPRLPSNRTRSANYIGLASVKLRSHVGSTSVAPPFAVFSPRPEDAAQRSCPGGQDSRGSDSRCLRAGRKGNELVLLSGRQTQLPVQR